MNIWGEKTVSNKMSDNQYSASGAEATELDRESCAAKLEGGI
jgi:hypothetical protein